MSKDKIEKKNNSSPPELACQIHYIVVRLG